MCLRLLVFPLVSLLLATLCRANVHIVKVQAQWARGAHWRARSAICQLPMAVGNCSRNFTRFYWDPERTYCHKFIYSGCGGNSNRFLSRHQCKKRCSPRFNNHKKTKISAKLSLWHWKQSDCLRDCPVGGICVRGRCKCRKGFERKGSECVDTNECNWANCPENAHCVNFPGSFRCECQTGFAGSGFNCTQEKHVCSQLLDHRYERKCQPEQEWQPRWYFHQHSAQCRQFWYAGCQFGESQNFFRDEKSCQSICGVNSNKQQLEYSSYQFGPSVAVQKEEHKTQPIAEFCLDPFDHSLRQPCQEGLWKRRYYFDRAIGRCRVFWMDTSCERRRAGKRRKRRRESAGRSRNLFVHKLNCKRACEGDTEEQKEEEGKGWDGGGGRTGGVIQASYSRWDNGSQLERDGQDCGHIALADAVLSSRSAKDKKQRLERLRAKLMADGGGDGKGQAGANVCVDKFDWNLTMSCGKRSWQVRFFFDARMSKCRPFWNDGCEGKTLNQFDRLEACQRVCERDEHIPRRMVDFSSPKSVMSYKGKTLDLLCKEPFDRNLRKACNDGKEWTRKWYFDINSQFCHYFWYDGCKSKSRNMFDGLKECMDACVRDNEGGTGTQPFSGQNEPANIGNRLAYFSSSAEEQMNHVVQKQAHSWPFHRNYIQSETISLNETQCTGFRYNSTGKARLNAFMCLLEEGGGCQLTMLWATNGAEQCHLGRSWLKGEHSYAWFFTLERGPSRTTDDELSSKADKGNSTPAFRRRTGSSVLTLRQGNRETTNSVLLVPVEQFGQENETMAWLDLMSSDQCHLTC